MAERGLLRSAHSAEVADRRRSISAEFAALLAAAEQRIVAHVQGKIASIDPALSMAARHAAIEQFIAEQTAAILQLKQDIKQQRRHARRAAGASLRGRFKKRRRALVARHAVEREETRDRLRSAACHLATASQGISGDTADDPSPQAAGGAAPQRHAATAIVMGSCLPQRMPGACSGASLRENSEVNEVFRILFHLAGVCKR